MNQPLGNVAAINTNTVYGKIHTFISNKTKRSANTGKEYLSDIRLFFKIIKHKELEDLTLEDIRIDLPALLEYQNILVDSDEYKYNTINRKISSLRSLYSFFKGSGYDVNPYIFKEVDDLPDDTENIGFLSPDEAKLIAQLALNEKHSGLEKRAIILLAASTSLRKDAILNIRYMHIKKHESKNGVYLIESSSNPRARKNGTSKKKSRLFDKNKLVKGKEIHEDMYNMLMELKGDRSDTDKVFTLSPSGLDIMIKRLCKVAQFDPNRRISFHSLKKAGIKWVREATGGDVVAIKAQGGWSSLAVAERYLEPEANMAGLGMFENLSEEVFDELTKEEMLGLLKSFGNGIGAQLRGKAQEIIRNRK